MFSLASIVSRLPTVKIVDVGAMDLGKATSSYYRLTEAAPCEVVGFEPVAHECDKLNAAARAGYRFFPYVIGDGSPRTFYECATPETSSVFPPNKTLIGKFTGFEELFKVVAKRPVTTKRLDDIPEVAGTDFLKLDVQGAEVMVLQGALATLRNVSVVHTEAEFVQIYENQPLFGDVDAFLRAQGFVLHKIIYAGGRFFKPFWAAAGEDATVNQMLWCDVVYVRDFLALDGLTAPQLLKMAAILHENYASHDLAALALEAYDRKTGEASQARYLSQLYKA